MTKISEELLPCPFCGWQPDTENRPSHGTDIYCANETCGGARIVVSADETERHGEEAIHRWNTRTSPPPSSEAGEPVAWRWQHPETAHFVGWIVGPQRPEDSDGWVIEPLYALPTIKEPTDE
jgi:hypothetical protein